MNSSRFYVLVLLASFAACLVFGCGGDDDPGHGARYYSTISVFPAAGGGYNGVHYPADTEAGQYSFYPGVTCFRANHMIRLGGINISADGRFVTFTIRSLSKEDIDLLWFRLWLGGGAQLISEPSVVNGRGQNIFVVGPLAGYGTLTMTIEVVPPARGGYRLNFEFLDVKQRVAYASDRANPGVGDLEEIFSIGYQLRDRYQVTRNGSDVAFGPQWSPGAEWIVFMRLMPQTCLGDIHKRAQVFLVHPDGSNLAQISQNMYVANNPSWNPTGDLVVYDCRAECDGVGYATDICMYDLRTGVQSMLISGAGYYSDTILDPSWSPDGKYIVYYGRLATTRTLVWHYLEVDPYTGAALGAPTIFYQNNKKVKFDDDNMYHWTVVSEFDWAPDSRHAVIRTDEYMSDGGPWKIDFRGAAIVDFQEVLDAPALPIVPHIVRVLDDSETLVNAPRFTPDGLRLMWDRTENSGLSDLEYMELRDYKPVDGLIHTYLHDGFYNISVAPFGPPQPGFAPLSP